MTEIAFRLDANAQIGTGHLMRCLTLANELKQRGSHCTFYCAGLTPSLQALIRDAQHKIVVLKAVTSLGRDMPAPVVDWLVVDHYGLSADDEDAAGMSAKHRMVIDDLADRPHHCDVLLDQSPHRTPNDYVRWVGENCRLLLGAEFGLLRPEFRLHRHPRPSRWEKGLICFGGADPTGATLQTLHSIACNDALRALKWTVISGAANPHHGEIETLVAKHLPSFTVIQHTTAMAALMASHDFAIGAAGGMVLERACIGLPALAVVVAPNQTLAAKAIRDLGVGIIINTTELKDSLRLNTHLNTLKNHADAYQKKGMALVDGRGVERVADHLIQAKPPSPATGRPT